MEFSKWDSSGLSQCTNDMYAHQCLLTSLRPIGTGTVVVVGISNMKKQTSRNKMEQMLQPENLEGSTELYLSHQIKIITYLSSSLFQLECLDTPVSSQTLKFMKISRKAASPFNHQAECEQPILGLSCMRKCFYEILFLCFSWSVCELASK